MADSSGSNGVPDTIATAQAQKEVTANAFFDAASAATFGGRRESASSALTWAFYGGKYLVGGAVTALANGSVVLTAASTNYVEFNPATGSVSRNTTGFTAGRVPLYTVVAGASTVTSWTDERAWLAPRHARLSLSVAGSSNVTLSAAQARAEIIEFTGALTGNIAVIAPNHWPLKVLRNLTSGAFTLTVRTSGGTGPVIAQARTILAYADGTDVIRCTPDQATP